MLVINSTGNNIVLLRGNNDVVWSTSPLRKAQNPVLQLLDSGNLVLKEENDTSSQNFVWQSFDYPSDTLLPGMKLGKDFKTCLDRRLIAWKNQYDPFPGNLTWGMEVNSYPELMMWLGSNKYYRGGPWNGIKYSSKQNLEPQSIYDVEHFSHEDEVYYMYRPLIKTMITRIVLNSTNAPWQHLIWIEKNKTWKLNDDLPNPKDFCDPYGACGPNGKCDIGKSPTCECLEGFQPKSPSKWSVKDYAEGCVGTEQFNCLSDGFVNYFNLKLPDTMYSWLNQSMDLEECRVKCLNNRSCMAYANSNITILGAGRGCAMWFSDLMDIRVQEARQDLYIRVPAPELESTNAATKRKVKIGLMVGSASACGMLLVVCYICRSRMVWKGKDYPNEEEDNLELPLFNLSRIASATNNFSIRNKLGQGGFGSVYKGILNDGLEIAVKRLSRSSCQGLNELKNEVNLIAKLQHRNLVRLLGCCIEEEEKLLIYEYMPNKGLDSFIFDKARGKHLDWSKRFNIICGIARGLLYLHQDSKPKIIHRDIKASNVLLDSEMNPKISDFGLAISFVGEQSVEITNRVVGTYFGILLLEIVTGKKNTGFYDSNENLNLVGHAWNLWSEGQPVELIEECLRGSCPSSDIVRMIHISLLCVQKHPRDRPSMSSVILMLDSKMALPEPREPGFYLENHPHDHGNLTLHENETPSANKLSITVLEAR